MIIFVTQLNKTHNENKSKKISIDPSEGRR
jgi:hypothetical protein